MYRKVTNFRFQIFEATQRLSQCPEDSERLIALRNLQTLQRRMVFSYENLCLSVTRITQISKARNTPGVYYFFVNTKEDRYCLIIIR